MNANTKPRAAPMGEFEIIIDDMVQKFGGYALEHAHLDRAGTIDQKYLTHYGIDPLQASSKPLKVKQVLTGELHRGPAYDEENLRSRMQQYINFLVGGGVKRIVSFIDATPDTKLTAVRVADELKKENKGIIDLKIAAHPIFGFKEDPSFEKSRWEVFKEACRIADIVGALPEKDDRPDSVGADEHIRRVIKLGLELDKEVHVHVDQNNDPRQRQTLDLIEAVRWLVGKPENQDSEPRIWAIHVISPSAYSEGEFKKILEGLKTYNIGVICCPRAAISMMQLRSLLSPAHNSIARVLEMALYGIKLRFGTDNIADMFIPTSSGRMLDEIMFLADSVRFYNPMVLAKFAAGIPLNRNDEDIIRGHLEEYKKALEGANPDFKFCLEL